MVDHDLGSFPFLISSLGGGMSRALRQIAGEEGCCPRGLVGRSGIVLRFE